MKKALFIFIAILVGIYLILYRSDLSVRELVQRYRTPQSHYITVDGMDVHYRIEGNPSDTLPLVLLHGTGAMLQTWDGWVQVMLGYRRMIRLDLPGYAITGPHPQNLSSGTYYADFLMRFLDKLGEKRCDLAGNSLGGNIAWHVALRYPNRVRKLILIDAAGYPFVSRSVPIGFKLARVPGVAGLLAKLTPDALFRSSLENVYYNDSLITDKLVQTYADLNRREGNRENFVRRKPAVDSLWQKIGQIKQPTLLMWGQHDDLIPLSVADRFHHDMPNDTLIVYPNAGHVPMEEIPARTAYDALQFLSKER